MNLTLKCNTSRFAVERLVQLGVRSFILTSGTLSPMKAFPSNFGLKFLVSKTFSHVIDTQKQVYCSIVQKLPSGCQLNFNYTARDNQNMIRELGEFLIKAFEITPGGVLIFFTSYTVMDKYVTDWKTMGLFHKMQALKSVSIEMSKKSAEFRKELAKFADNVDRPGGAALMGVFGGKISEGIDFSDQMARLAILVGVPFPNISSLDIKAKKAYQDKLSVQPEPVLLPGEEPPFKETGNDWYNSVAIRSFNQAIGRVIRHRGDFGAILLLDERFAWRSFSSGISSWAKEQSKTLVSTQTALLELPSFFKDAQAHVASLGYKPKPVDKQKFLNEIQDNENQEMEGSRSPEKKLHNNQYQRYSGATVKQQPQNKGVLFFAPRNKSAGPNPEISKLVNSLDPTDLASNIQAKKPLGKVWSEIQQKETQPMMPISNENLGLLTNLTGEPSIVNTGASQHIGNILQAGVGNTDMDSGYRRKFEEAFDELRLKAVPTESPQESSP
jgi:Helicase C-terminal domain